MDIKEILSHIDHTALNPTTVWDDIEQLLDDAIKYQVASVCIPPSFVKNAVAYAGRSIPVGTVIGFPNGYQTTKTKVFETAEAVGNGATEIDMVIHQGWVKSGLFDQIEQEITAIREACPEAVLKVIVETSNLTPIELTTLCQIVTAAQADYIKTSTGFSASGASPEDVLRMAANIGPSVKIKASGGIRTLEQARQYLDLGADRIGSSQIVAAMKTSHE